MHTVECRKIRRPSPGAIENEELMFDEQRFRHNRPHATRPEKPGERGQKMDHKYHEVPHREAMVETPSRIAIL